MDVEKKPKWAVEINSKQQNKFEEKKKVHWLVGWLVGSYAKPYQSLNVGVVLFRRAIVTFKQLMIIIRKQ